MTKLIGGCLASLVLSGCISVSERRMEHAGSVCAVGEPMVETMLFLGMARPGGSVSRFEFQQFVETEVAPRCSDSHRPCPSRIVNPSFQRGITEREPSRVLVRFHDGSTDASAGVEAIRDAYIRTFEQDAVLRTDRTTCADF